MLRALAILLILCGSAHSEERSPRESESKAEAVQPNNQKGATAQQPAAPASATAPPIINIYTAKHASEESHCARPKDWKEWGSFAWCRSLEWIDAERVIAVWTVVLGIATCILGIATWKLWRSTDRLVKGAEDTSERQLRAYVGVGRNTGFRFDAVEKYHGWIFEFVNTGQTPAYNLRFIGKMNVLPVIDDTVNLIEKYPVQFLDGHGDKIAMVAAQGYSRGYANIDKRMSATKLDQVFSDPGQGVYVWGKGEYYDVFKKRRTFTLAYRIFTALKFASVDPSIKFGTEQFSADQCKLGNDAD